MLKAEKAGVWQTPQTLFQEESWLLMPRLLQSQLMAMNAVDLDMSCFLPPVPMRQRFAKCNDTVSFFDFPCFLTSWSQ